MEHYVMGLVFNINHNKVLLIKKLKPNWMKGHWNGIGGHIEEGETAMEAMIRESEEECGHSYLWEHKITFTCPGGIVFVFAAIYPHNEINFEQIEEEILRVWDIYNLPTTMMSNLKCYIPLCLASFQFLIMINQTNLGIKN